ncbi:cell division protein FtsQ/DivIB [Limnohabitans sp. DCL3]|uniref:cell division protein FtsQ/DivIB n=1 Tax=Limnohabitans sp. DCL3 TaxID=3374103 RepID=UPI003A868C67
MPLPLDVRLMNMAAGALLAVFLLLLLGGGAWWLVRHPLFAIKAITVQGEVTRNNAITLRANVVPHLQGNFFTMDLNRTKEAFEAVPWVRDAVVHRDFPNRLRTVLVEHEPMALWGDESANKMVNQQSRVFEANVEDVDIDKLPRLKGPDAQSETVVQMYRHLLPLFETMDMGIDQLELTPRGSWRVLTDRGALLELGRGSEAEVTALLKVFFKTLSQVTARYGRTPVDLTGADLRHTDGYALRLRGVTTLDTDGKKKL